MVVNYRRNSARQYTFRYAQKTHFANHLALASLEQKLVNCDLTRASDTTARFFDGEVGLDTGLKMGSGVGTRLGADWVDPLADAPGPTATTAFSPPSLAASIIILYDDAVARMHEVSHVSNFATCSDSNAKP